MIYVDTYIGMRMTDSHDILCTFSILIESLKK